MRMKDFKKKIETNKNKENKSIVEIRHGDHVIKVNRGRVRISESLLVDYTTEALRGYTPEKNEIIRLSACCDAMFDLLVTEAGAEKISMKLI